MTQQGKNNEPSGELPIQSTLPPIPSPKHNKKINFFRTFSQTANVQQEFTGENKEFADYIEFFDIEEKMAFGKKMKAKHQISGQILAFKFMEYMNPKTEKIFYGVYDNAWHEVQIMKELNSLESRLITKFLSFSILDKEETKNLLIKMEDGGCNLSEMLTIRKTTKQMYSSEECLLLAYDIIEGLLQAKSLGIAHRNIKSANIAFITYDKKGYKIGGWGLAYKLGSKEVESRAE